MAYANVIASGNSAVVTLPKRFREINAIKVGDRVSLGFPAASMMTIEPIKQEGPDKAVIFAKFREQVHEDMAGAKAPMTREETRALLSERYE